MEITEDSKSVFLSIMGDYPINRVLDFLIVFDDFDYSLTDIAKNSKVSYSTLQLFWKQLEENEIVVMSRIVGKAKMFKLNKSNLAVKQFIKMFWAITNNATEKLGEVKEVLVH